MGGSQTAPRLVRGIVHCHSSLSYDSKVSLTELRNQLQSRGFHFVALTEHTLGVSRQAYDSFVEECRSLSSDEFLILPGLEFRCEQGIEIAGLGLSSYMEGSTVADVVRQVRSQGGYAVWVHPKKRGYRVDRILDCDAVEVLNGKLDGTVAPDFEIISRVLKDAVGKPHMIFGLDLHSLQQSPDVWLECPVVSLEPGEVMQALRAGKYWNHVPRGRISSRGEMSIFTGLRLKTLRWLYICWNFRIPPAVRTGISIAGRPLIQRIKRSSHRKPDHR